MFTYFQHDKKLSKRQSKLRDRMQSQMRERQKTKRASTAPPRLNQENADDKFVHVALLAVLQEDALNSKKDFDKEVLIDIAGNKDGIADLIHEYDIDTWKQYREDLDLINQVEGAQSKEEIIATKIAQQQLDAELEYEMSQSEQLKQSSLKQVHCTLISDYFALCHIKCNFNNLQCTNALRLHWAIGVVLCHYL